MIVEGGSRDDVPQLAVLAGTLDNPERILDSREPHVRRKSIIGLELDRPDPKLRSRVDDRDELDAASRPS